MKIGITTEFSYAHRIQNHPGKCKRLHGHNGKLEVQVEGDADTKTGMIIDFSNLKQIVKTVVDSLDHMTILHFKDPLCESIPVNSLIRVTMSPTAETISAIILNGLRILIPNIKVRLWETEDSYVEITGEDREWLEYCTLIAEAR